MAALGAGEAVRAVVRAEVLAGLVEGAVGGVVKVGEVVTAGRCFAVIMARLATNSSLKKSGQLFREADLT